MELDHPRSFWLLLAKARPLASQPRASPPVPWDCMLVSVLRRFWGWDHSASWSQSWPTGLPLCSSQPDPLFLSSCALAICLCTWNSEKKKKSEWPMENFIADQTSSNPSLLCSILKSIYFGLSSVRFVQLWRCPDSQQSCWVTILQSELEICYCALK